MFFTVPRSKSAIKNIRIYRTLERVVEVRYESYKGCTADWQRNYDFAYYLKLFGNDVWYGSETEPPRKITMKEILAIAEMKKFI